VEKNTGHRLVLSNNSKKWISADGVEKIQAVSEVAASAAIPDYGTTLVQLLKSHLQAVAERAWTDSSCMTARAGFCVSDPTMDQTMLDEMTGQPKQAPIEVKVTIRPPKPKTPPPKLMITPVQGARLGNQKMSKSQTPNPTSGSKLVKITANRRIIPVRDPTSISTPPRIPKTIAKSDVETKAKIAALRESLKANAKLNDTESSKIIPKLPKNTTISQAEPKPAASVNKAIPDDEEIDSDLEKEDDFESIDAIADFINNSEPPQKPVNPRNSDLKVSSLEDQNICDVADEFTDQALNTPKPQIQKNMDQERELQTPDAVSKSDIKLPKGTVVTNVASPDPKPNASSEVESEKMETEDIKLPPGLKISMAPAGMVKIQAGAPKSDPKVIEVGPKIEAPAPKAAINNKNVIELGNPKTESLPSPASDATTSTKDTVTPNSLTISKTKRPFMPRLLPRQGQETPQQADKAQKDEKTSTVKQVPKKIETPKNRLPKKETELSDHEIEHLTSLDLDLDLDSEEEAANGAVKKSAVKLSSILPKPSPKANKATPASSSKKGAVVSKPAPKITEKRKRLEEATAAAAAANTKAKKLKIDSEEEFQDVDQMRPFKCEKARGCNSRFFRETHLTRHEKQHTPETEQISSKTRGKSFSGKEKFKLDAKEDPDSDAASAITSGGQKGKPFKINISLQEKDLANKQLTPQQLAHKVLAEKQLEKVAKTSHVVQAQKANQPHRVSMTPKRPLQTPKASKQVESTTETPSNEDQEAKASGPDFIKGTSQSGRIRKVKKIFDL